MSSIVDQTIYGGISIFLLPAVKGLICARVCVVRGISEGSCPARQVAGLGTVGGRTWWPRLPGDLIHHMTYHIAINKIYL